MSSTIKKRDGREAFFDESKITEAIFKAAKAVGGADKQLAMELTLDVLRYLKQTCTNEAITVEDVQDAVEKVLIEKGHARTAKAYILYRAKRTQMREAKSDL
ncbi:ATP cone domain-containing protein, partial [Anaerospora hongkongensis]